MNHGTTSSKKAGGIIYEHNNFYKRIVNANQVAPSEKICNAFINPLPLLCAIPIVFKEPSAMQFEILLRMGQLEQKSLMDIATTVDVISHCKSGEAL